MATRPRSHGWPEVLLGGILWALLLIILLATVSFPELGTWIYR
jgi:hypothetical protein